MACKYASQIVWRDTITLVFVKSQLQTDLITLSDLFDLAFHGIPYVPGNCDKQKLAMF